MFTGLLVMLLAGQPAGDSGFLTVNSNMPGIGLYLDGEYIGITPLEQHKLAPGNYSLSIVSNDSLENVYWHLRSAPIGARLSSVWTLAAINAGTHAVSVSPGVVTEVFLDYGRVLSAPNEARLLACCGVGGLFGLGAAVGFLVHLLFFR